MAKRFRIGLNYFFNNQTNSGIVNYIYNIISALKTLKDEEQPEIVVFYSQSAPIEYLKEIDYPYIQFLLFQPHPKTFLLRKVNSSIRKFFGTDPYKQTKYFNKIDCLYPYFAFLDIDFIYAKKKIHWLVDFNNRAFPDHYQDKGESMKSYQEKLAYSTEKVILSSDSLVNELKHYHPGYTCNVKVLRFASSLPLLNTKDTDIILQNHNIDVPYFMSPNQFWEHKNQLLVLDALNIIKHQLPELKFKVIFSGSLFVNRGKGLYADKLREKIEQYQLSEYIIFSGILERKEQLLLMKKAVALIQPSLYEGWSTLVEEAKALNKYILLSDLPVHREQISVNVDFFDPHNADELAKNMIKQLNAPDTIQPIDYYQHIQAFGKKIIDAFQS